MISIVIPTYNEQRKKDLLQCLDSIMEQSFRDFEIVLVVEQSRSLYRALSEYLDRFAINHQVIFSEGIRSISYARNLGAKVSHGEIVAFIDDDVILLPDWAGNVDKAYLKHPEAIGVSGQAVPLWIDKGQEWFPRALYWMIGCTGWRNWAGEKETNTAAGANMSFRREAFRIAQFREDMGGGASSSGKRGFPNEDNDYAMKITSETGRPIIYAPSVLLYHKVYPYRVTNEYIRKYAFWQGCAEARYSTTPYSRGKRLSVNLKVFLDLLTEFVGSGSWSRGEGFMARKLRVVILTTTFFFAGYVAFISGVHRLNHELP